MLNEATYNKLVHLKLKSMADSFVDQRSNSKFMELSFEERFGIIVDAEWSKRQSKRIDRYISKAGFRFREACVEDIDYSHDRQINKSQILSLATGSFIFDRLNVIITGASGSGKTYLGCALGNAACRNNFSVRYIRLPDLLGDLAIARGDGSYKKLINQYKKVNLLIFDEWFLIPFSLSEAMDILEIVEARYQSSSTIFLSQFAPQDWHAKIPEGTIADAVLDRIAHNSYMIHVSGDSMRKKHGAKKL